MLRCTDPAERLRPFAGYNVSVKLLFLLSPNRASSSECAHLAILADRNRRPAPAFSARIPSHLINLVQVNSAIFAFVLFDCSTHANHTAAVARVLTDDHPISPRFAQFLFKLIPKFNRSQQSRFFASVLSVADKFRPCNVTQPYSNIPTDCLVFRAINTADALIATLCHAVNYFSR